MKSAVFLLFLSLYIVSCKDKVKTETLAYTESISPKTNKIKPEFISETLELTSCESAVYDSETDIIYASLIGNREPGDGSVVTLSLDGEILNKTFIDGLNDPKGIAITNNKLYVSDVKELVEADLKTGEILKKYSLPSIVFLNDVAIDASGHIYVSDTSTSEIYKLNTNGEFSLWLADDALDKPNGLLIHKDIMYVASWGSAPEGGRLSKINMTSKKIDTISKIIGNLDGIRFYDDERLIISDWNSGNIHLIDFEGHIETILTVGKSVGDIAYIKEKDLLLLPMNRQSRLLFYTFK